jgi:nicotinamidase/pyrazinamidase
MTPGADTALVVVDVQNCFTPCGSLAVQDGDTMVPVINTLARSFADVVLTQDWHTPDHASFASQHPGLKPFDTVPMPYGTQVLWPEHCTMGTEGAALHYGLSLPHAQLVIRKGYHRGVDSYSGFLEADRTTRTGLDGYLTSRGIRHIYITGLATDFCVAWTALDARRFGFEATVVEDACRAIDLQGSLAEAWAEMETAGVHRIRSEMIG